MHQHLVNLHVMHVQFVQKKTKKLQKQGLHEAQPKIQFKEYYGIFHSGQKHES